MSPPTLLKLIRGTLAAVAASSSLAACDEFPRDPGGTLDRVRGGVLRVGLIHDPPWVDLSGPAPAGAEVALAAALAEELGARLRWAPAGQTEALDALKRRELDLVVGGLTSGSPWASEVAFTRPYLETRTVVAAREIDSPLHAIDGLPILVDPGTLEPALVESGGGAPVTAPALGIALEAKAGWELAPGEAAVFVLHSAGHVVAVPPGENGWLVRVDRFTADRGARTYAMLRRDAP